MIVAIDIKAAVARAADAMRRAEDELNAADSKLGDGDTGQTMRRVAEAVSAAADAAPDNADLGVFFRQLGMAGMGATGSSLGTLVSVGLLEIGKAFKGRASASAEDLIAALFAAEKAMLMRGNAELGAKTALDVLHAARVQLAHDPADPSSLVAVARAALDTYRDKPCRMGRARMYADGTVGLDDPGMLAFTRLTEAIVEIDMASDPISFLADD